MDRYTYSSQTKGTINRISEIRNLLRMSRRSPEAGVDWVMNLRAVTRQRMREVAGLETRGKKGLDIGPGQKLGCLRSFAVDSDMVGIDTDVIPQGFDPREYLRMLRKNSAMRVIKTLGRKALGVDARFERGLADRLGVDRLPKVPVLNMNAGRMTFPDANFDFVYSHSVFEHIDDPEDALREVTRVLKPGGAAYIGIHLYTCHSGCHDPKLLAEEYPEPPFWPHLRPKYAGQVRSNAYLNKLRIKDWETLFENIMPGTRFYRDRHDDWLEAAIPELRAAGELTEYSDDELMTINLIAVWKKPQALQVARAS